MTSTELKPAPDAPSTDDLDESAVTSAPRRLFIGGEWVEAADGAVVEVNDPATGQPLLAVSDATVADGLAALDAATSAGPDWAATAPRQRGEILRRAFELMTESADRLARIIVAENGKALADARSEVTYAAEFFRWFSEEAVRIDGHVQQAPAGTNRIMVLREPVGVAVLVTPWNFPAAMATRKIAPALAAGCTLILKPATETPLTALAIAEILAAAGVPAGVVNVIPSTRSADVVSTLLHDDRVRKLSFTGSTAVGSRLLREAADNVVNTAMELGGNAPFVVFDDADLDSALDGAMVAKMRNGGEACTAANRFIVQRGIADAFVAGLTSRMAGMTMGPGSADGTKLGPLVNESTRDKVASLVQEAIDHGARATTGGSAPDQPGWFYPATVLVDVPRDAALLREEIFGPVAPVVLFTDEDEAVELANDTEFGLVSYVYSGDLKRGLRVSGRLETGMVGLNRAIVSDPAAPFGGVKASGIGREGGHEGVLDYTETKYIAVEW